MHRARSLFQTSVVVRRGRGRDLRHEDLSFLNRAPLQQVHRGQVALPVDRVFDILAERPESWPDWFSLARECHYEGVPPHGVGTIRHVSLRGGIHAREQMLAWDRSKRLAYRVEELDLPGIQAFMEEWTIEPLAADRTELQWVLALDCPGPLRLLLRTASNRVDRIFREAACRMATLS
jgi:hypothetical protein